MFKIIDNFIGFKLYVYIELIHISKTRILFVLGYIGKNFKIEFKVIIV